MVLGIYFLSMFVLMFLFISLYKKDYTLIMFSGMFFVILGLYILTNGYGDISIQFNFALSIINIFVGLYILFRTTVDILKD
jgi:hypothetical protein